MPLRSSSKARRAGKCKRGVAVKMHGMSNHEPQGGERPKIGDELPDEETGQFGDATDPGLESDEDLDGEQDADGGQPLHGG